MQEIDDSFLEGQEPNGSLHNQEVESRTVWDSPMGRSLLPIRA